MESKNLSQFQQPETQTKPEPSKKKLNTYDFVVGGIDQFVFDNERLVNVLYEKNLSYAVKANLITQARLRGIHALGKIQFNLRSELNGHLGKITDLCWNPDGTRLVSASQDGQIMVWDAHTGYKEAVLALNTNWVMTCNFSPSGNYVAAGGLDNTIAVYKVPTSDEVWNGLEKKQKNQRSGRKNKSNSQKFNKRLFDSENKPIIGTDHGREKIRQLQMDRELVLDNLPGPDDKDLNSKSQQTSESNQKKKSKKKRKNFLGKSNDNNHVEDEEDSDFDYNENLFEQFNNESDYIDENNDHSDDENEKYDPDLFNAEMDANEKAKHETIERITNDLEKFYNERNKLELSAKKDFYEHPERNEEYKKALDANEELIKKQLIEIFKDRIDFERPFFSILRNPYHIFAQPITDLTVFPSKLYAEFLGHDAYISGCEFLSEEKLVSSSGDRTAALWDVNTNKQIMSYTDSPSALTCLSVNHKEPQCFITGGSDPNPRLWDLRIGNRPAHVYEGFHRGEINSVKFLKDSYSFLTGSNDGTVRLFDIRLLSSINVFATDNPNAQITAVESSSSMRLAIGAFLDGSVIAWDALTGKEYSKFLPHKNLVSCVSISPDGYSIATGSHDYRITTWVPGKGSAFRRS